MRSGAKLVVPAACVWACALGGCGATAGRQATSGIPAALLAQMRPVGVGPRFEPRARGPVGGACRRRLGARDGVHVELFAANRVVIVPAGIGVQPPVRESAGRIVGARCYGDLVTLSPTGVVLVRPGRPLTLADLFRSWGQPLSDGRLATFTAPRGGHVSVFIAARLRRGSPERVRLTRHAEIVLEVGPHVPPHRSFDFPPGI
jgi:hypothetical protein